MSSAPSQVGQTLHHGGGTSGGQVTFFHLLHEQRQAIEHERGYPLEWEELPTRRDCRISVYMTNVDPEDERDWPRQHQWLTSKINDFHRVFLARVRDLDAEDWKQDGVVDVSAGPSQADG